jgi:hypothetical protein
MLLPGFGRRRGGCGGRLLMRWVRRSRWLPRRIGALDLRGGSGRRNMCCRVRGMLGDGLVWLLRRIGWVVDGYALTIVGSKAPYALGAGVHGVWWVSDVISITSFPLRSLSANAHTIRPRWMDGAVDRKSPRERAKSRLASFRIALAVLVSSALRCWLSFPFFSSISRHSLSSMASDLNSSLTI